ncbi:Ribosome biogenesis protein erb1 [Tulasnella sp. JGI-2019a]|nr:Ribosome biogenesis protein erb1 [Tulasnella sp. JGI-2019a]
MRKRKDIYHVAENNIAEKEGTSFGEGNDDKGGIEMPSEDEESESVVGMSKKVNGLVIGGAVEEDDDEAVDEFPEINSQSDDEETGSDDEDEDEDADEEGSESDETSPDEDVNGAKQAQGRNFDERTPGIFPKAKIVTSDITGEAKKTYPEIEPDYNSDSSTEDQPNRVGRIPMHWYDDLPHVGYDMEGKKVLRPAKGDELDRFLATHEDPKSWMSGFDHSGQKDTELSTEELDLIRRLHEAENPDATYNPYEPTVEWFTGKGKEEVMPLSGRPQPKSRWQPSKWEKQKVMKIVRLIRAGKIVPRKPKATQPQWYNIWSKDTEAEYKYQPPIAAPKMPLPKHAESYNPPEEYLPNSEEKKAFDEMDNEDKMRAGAFLPKKYGALRLVPGYEKFIQERHSRLLDLYLAPRIQKVRLNINPDSLLPSLPSPQSLKPFPVFEALKMSGGGSSRARCLSVSPDGVWTAAGGEDGVVRIWETFVGREAARWELGHRIGALEWCPRKDVSFFMVGIEDEVYAFMPPYVPPAIQAATMEMLNPRNLPQPVATTSERSVKWTKESVMLKLSSYSYSSPLLVVALPSGAGTPKQITFHRRGDYFATVSSGEGQNGVWIHQLSKRHSQCPFRKIKGSIQKVLFHPIKPNFFVATQRYVRIYDLAAQKLVKTLLTGSRWISSMDVHPSGDHLIVGGYDKKLFWFDLDLADRPYKVLRYHTHAVRSVAFSTTYPLFASSSDDGTIQIFHARVYNDLLTDPLIVPLKVLRGHDIKDGLGVLDIKWATGLGTCWLTSAGADGEVRVWCN